MENKEEKTIRDILRAALPVVFGRPEVSRCLPGVISGKTLANLEAQGKGPESFLRGRRRFYDREVFIEWFVKDMSQKRDPE